MQNFSSLSILLLSQFYLQVKVAKHWNGFLSHCRLNESWRDWRGFTMSSSSWKRTLAETKWGFDWRTSANFSLKRGNICPSWWAMDVKMRFGLLCSEKLREQENLVTGMPHSLHSLVIVYASVVFPVPAKPFIQNMGALLSLVSPSIHWRSWSRISTCVPSKHGNIFWVSRHSNVAGKTTGGRPSKTQY